MRFVLACLASLCFLPEVSATLSPRHDLRTFDGPLPARLAKRLPSVFRVDLSLHAPAEEFLVTGRTEVTLNGRSCKYQAVPRDATVVRLELAADGKTVLKIDFRTKK